MLAAALARAVGAATLSLATTVVVAPEAAADPGTQCTDAPPSPCPAPSSTVALPPPDASTSDVRMPRNSPGQLAAVRLARQDGYDQLVFEFTDRVPGYTVGYRPLPARQDGSGNEIPLPGANALVVVALFPASAGGSGDAPRTYFGPSTITSDTAEVTAATAAGEFEAMVTWAVGLRVEVPFKVFELDGPPRLVIDFQD